MHTTRPPARPPHFLDTVLELGAREGLFDAAPTWRPPSPTHDDLHPELLPPPYAGDEEG